MDTYTFTKHISDKIEYCAITSRLKAYKNL